ncbi:MAG: serine acetyltransferase [Clostridiales bacterium]|nr:serine acetyltransferase [Clostridiales bacterium]
MGKIIEEKISEIVSSVLTDYNNGRVIDRCDLFSRPDTAVVNDIIHKLLMIIYPGYFFDKAYRVYAVDHKLSLLVEDIMYNLNKQIVIALRFHHDYKDAEDSVIEQEAEEIAVAFFEKLPEIRAYLDTDLEAAYNGDPAAYYKDEIILSYPGLLAITINRLAHELYLLEVPLIPRMMTEYAHSRTGIDIHPGATIGKYFFIDHGTGIVIGESTEIGENVKIYQGVTLGALSTRGGQRLKSVKRHPTIRDNVTIYSGASILGGETVIGKGAVIGSNVFVTKSVGDGARVSVKNQELQFKYGKKEPITHLDLEQDEAWYYTI